MFVTLLMFLVSVLYGTAGQAGGSGFVAVMTLADFPLDHIRPTAFALNIVAASYAAIRAHRAALVDWSLLTRIICASLPASLLGGMIALRGPTYSAVTGCLLVTAALLMSIGRHRTSEAPLHWRTGVAGGAIAGFASGLTGVGGGVFLSSILILFGRVSPKTTAALSPPFIVVNSVAALSGALISGQSVPLAALPFAGAAIAGSAIGTAIGLRFMSARAIRFVLASILLAAATQMLVHAFQILRDV
jgi:uncharacterized membrane protein YfcA